MHVQAYLSCMDAIAAGCLTAMLVDSMVRRGVVLHKYLLLALEIAGNLTALWIILNPSPHMDFKANVYRRLLIFAICVVCFTVALAGRPGGALAAPLRFFGRYIYEAYLTHAIVISAVFWTYIAWHRGRMTLWILATLPLTAALAWACATFYSEPLNRLVRKTLLRRPPVKAAPIDTVSADLVSS